MAVIQIRGFQGENRALHPSLLPDMVGVTSLNQKTGRGDLRPWNAPLAVATVPAGRKAIYRMGRDVISDANYWLSWPTIVHAVRGGNASDTAERTYYTGDGTPKWTDNVKALAAAPYPTAARELGVPAPATPCYLSVTPAANVSAGAFVVGTTYTIIATGTTNFTLVGAANSTPGTVFSATGVGVGTGTAHANSTSETRYYTYTYVTDIGEESAPAAPSLALVCKTDDTVTISALAAAPSGNYGINRIRIYRTQTGQSGDTQFFFLREIASTLTTTTDDQRTLGEVMPTTTWLTPPADLKWLTGLWNGMMCGISGRSVRFCEAFTFYAWPLAYDILPAEVTPVALVTFGQQLVVLTNGAPILVSGGSPDAMDEQPSSFLQACIAPLSAVGMGHGVAWASPDGLCYIGADGGRVLTTGVMTRDDWQALKPETIQAGLYEGRYIATYLVAGVRKGFIWDPANPAGLFFLDFGWDALYFDDLQDALYLLDGVNIKKWDAGAALTTTFRSKLFRLPRPMPAFACAQVNADSYPVTLKVDYLEMKASDVTNIAALNTAFTAPTATSLRYTATATGNNPFRLPGGFHFQSCQTELVSSGSVQDAALAHSMEEIGQV